MKVINKDLSLLLVKQWIEKETDEEKRNVLCGLKYYLEKLPEIDASDTIDCKACYWYDKDKKRCVHKNGLSGRVLPGYFCSYGSPSREEDEEEPEPDFSEFDEEEDNGAD